MRFTLITEGVSENRIIKHILNKCFPNNELFFRDAQPQIVNNKQETIGGWNEVLKYCQRTEDLKEIFNNTDYLVIQIDTDQSQTSPFSVSHTKLDNSLKSTEELYQDVIDKLKELISNEILEPFETKIFFAISIHTIECWLLPLYYTNNHISDKRNCLTTLNTQLRRKNIDAIPIKEKNNSKAVRTYESILRNWKKKVDIINSYEHNSGFQLFVEALDIVAIKEK